MVWTFKSCRWIKNLGGWGVQKGAIGDFSGTTTKGQTYSGSTTELLRDLTGQAFFIDNGIAHCLNDNECLDGEIPKINAASGLLGTPLLESQFIHVETMFDPSLKIGQLVSLESTTNLAFNGLHKVISLKHRGIISEVVSGSATTEIGMLPGTFTKVQV